MNKIHCVEQSILIPFSLLLRFTDDDFDEEQSLTIGVDFKTKVIDIDGSFVKLGIFLIFTVGF